MSQTSGQALARVFLMAGLAFGAQQVGAWSLDFEDFNDPVTGNPVIVDHGQVINVEQASGSQARRSYESQPGIGLNGASWDYASHSSNGWTGNNGALESDTSGIYANGIPGASTGPSTYIYGKNNQTYKEYVVAFDSNETGTEDPDLQSQFKYLKRYVSTDADGAASGTTHVLDGGTSKINNGTAVNGGTEITDSSSAEFQQLQNPGNILIVQEGTESGETSYYTLCKDGICDSPDDEHPGDAYIYFEFESAVHLDSIDVFDLETGPTGGNGGQIDFWTDENGDGDLEFLACVPFPITLDNGAARIIFNGGDGFDNVVLAKVTLTGSGAVDNLVGAHDPSTPAPEPASLGLLGLGILGMRLAARRRAA